MDKNTKIIKSVEKWLRNFIIGKNICPFAKEPHQNALVNYNISDHKDIFSRDSTLLDTIKKQNAHQSPFYTNLIIYPSLHCSFEEFLAFIDIHKVKDIQLIAFHPHFQFQGTKKEAKANLVNQYEYPLVHLLSQRAVDIIIKGEGIGENISLNNEQLLQSLSEAELRDLLPWKF